MATPLNLTNSMPKMAAAFAGWTNTIILNVVHETVVDGLIKDRMTQISFTGTIQPLSPKAIALKPEGQRDWEWLWIHCTSGKLNLDTNDRIEVDGKLFKIMAEKDYSRNNYIEYHLVRDYEKRSNCS